MVTIEQLRERRDKEAKKLRGLQAIRKLHEAKKDIKEEKGINQKVVINNLGTWTFPFVVCMI